MMQNQHKKDMATSDVTAPAEVSEEPKPQGTRFKVVSPKNKTSPEASKLALDYFTLI